MSVATLSQEAQIRDQLRTSGLSAEQFCTIARLGGIMVNPAKLSLAFSGKKNLDRDTAARLLELLLDLKAIPDLFVSPVTTLKPPIDWSESERVSRLVVLARFNRVTSEE
jgi:hypothetical protein